MKNILYILLFLPFLGISQVNFSTYGAVGNGTTDDTAALQAAFDAGTNLEATAGKTFKITGTIRIDQNKITTADFKGSKIISGGGSSFMIDIDKRSYANTLTTIKNLELDGANRDVSGIDISSRVHLENVEIHRMIKNNANGIRNLIYNTVGCYGQWVFDNVDIHDLEPVGNDGTFGNDLGAAHGFLASAQQIPSQPTQIVYKNSSLYSIWGEDAGAITVFSAGLDISNTPVSFWFENINVADAQRRAVKGFAGNQTWINSRFTSATYDNPKIVRTMPSAGLFVIGAGSSAAGSTNNVVCGCIFEGHPDDPFNSWYTRVILVADTGPAGVKISNSTFKGANPNSHPDNGFTAFGSPLRYVSIDNSTFETQNGVRLVGNFSDYAYMSTNNTYVDGKTTTFSRTTVSYTEPTIAYADCPTIGGIDSIPDPPPPSAAITDLLFSSTGTRFEYVAENTISPTFTLIPETADTGQTYVYEIVPRAGNDDSSRFSITGNQLTLNLTPDYESPVDYNTNNIYALDVKVTASPSGETFTEDMVVYVTDVTDEGAEVYVTDIAFLSSTQTIEIGQKVDLSYELNGGLTTPTNTTTFLLSEDLEGGKVNPNRVGVSAGTVIFTITADDQTNGLKEHAATITITEKANPGSAKGTNGLLKLNRN